MPNRRQRRLLRRRLALFTSTTNCKELRRRVVAAKQASKEALTANAEAKDDGREPPFSEGALMQLRGDVRLAAQQAREAGCNIDDLVNRHVGDRESSL